MTPKMDYDGAEERERSKRAVRAFHDARLIETFRIHGLSIAEMDRTELLGVISFLATNGQFVRTAKMTVEEITRELWETVKTPDDVTRVLDSLAAHVVFMEIEEPIQGEMFDALQAALKEIQRHQ